VWAKRTFISVKISVTYTNNSTLTF